MGGANLAGVPTETSRLTLRRARPADVADAETLADLGARTFDETFAATNDPDRLARYLATAFTPERLAAELADPVAAFWIAVEDGGRGPGDGRAVGYAKLASGEVPACVGGPRPIELVRLYVERSVLGGGVGAALIAACLEHAREAGFATIWLGVWEHNLRARRFYDKWGFRVVGAKPFYFADELQEDLVMERPVAGGPRSPVGEPARPAGRVE